MDKKYLVVENELPYIGKYFLENGKLTCITPEIMKLSSTKRNKKGRYLLIGVSGEDMAELQDGDKVTLRNGIKLIVFGNRLHGMSDSQSVSFAKIFFDKKTGVSDSERYLDIVLVERDGRVIFRALANTENTKNLAEEYNEASYEYQLALESLDKAKKRFERAQDIYESKPIVDIYFEKENEHGIN